MDIITRHNGYAHNLYVVRLTAEEAALEDRDLINYVDNGGKSLLRCNFGGVVERRMGLKTETMYAKVKVYTD